MHLLIALDNSPLNERIVGFLKKFLSQLSNPPTFSFIHVIDSSIIGPVPCYADVAMNYDESGISIEDEDELIRQLRRDSTKMIEGIQKQLGVTGTVDFPIDDPCEALAQECQKKKPDLLVIGTHSRKGINHFLFGNFAEKVGRHINVPLIVIPEKGNANN